MMTDKETLGVCSPNILRGVHCTPQFLHLVERIRLVTGVTGPLVRVHLDENGSAKYPCWHMTFEHDAPTASLQELNPGHYGLCVEYTPYGKCGGWNVKDYGSAEWYFRAIEEDDELL